jgi:tetratricopeptide (TPR) repeat protein
MKKTNSGKLKYWQLLLLTTLVLTVFSACSSTPPRIAKKPKPQFERTILKNHKKKPASTFLEKTAIFFNGESTAPPLLPYQQDLKKAEYRTHLQEFPEAEFYLKRVLLQIPDEPSALKLLPWIHFYQRRYDKALLAFERHHAIDPKAPGILAGMGWCYLAMNNFKQALETFQKAAKYSPDEYNINKGRAIIFLKQKNPSKALPFLNAIYTPQEVDKILTFWESEGENMSASSYPVLPDNSDTVSLLTLPVDEPRYRSMLWGLSQTENASPQLETAWRYFRQGLYRRALKAFQNLPQTLSETLDAQNGLAWSYFKNKNIQKADQTFNRVAQTYPKFIGVVKGLRESENFKLRKAAHAQYYLDMNKLRIAERKYRTLIKEFPDWAHSYAQMGRIALKFYNLEVAQEFLHTALKLEPRSEAGLLGMEEMEAIREPDLYEANQALKHENYQEAASLYRDYIDHHKGSTPLDESLARAFNGLGWSQYHKGLYRPAIEKFIQSKKYKKFESDSIRGIGLSYFHIKSYTDAVTYLRFAHGRQPTQQQGYYELDWSILRSWGGDRARQYFEKELQVDPLRASLYMGMGWIHYKDNKPDLAVEFFLKAISLNPDSAVSSEFFDLLGSQRFGWQVYNRLGWAYYHKRDFDRSLEMFRTSLKERPDKPGAHQGIGYNLYQMGKYASAITYLEKSLHINPASVPVMETALDEESKNSLRIRTTARTKLARAYYHSGNYLKAIRYYQKDLTFHPELADAHAGLGWAYLKLRRLTESRAAFNESLKLEPLKTHSHKGLKEVKQLLATQNIRVKKPGHSTTSMTSSMQKLSPN